jgi:hypothetical protein
MGGSGKADVSGAVQELAGQPAGPVLLWSSFAACLALALWQTSDAIFDFGHLPKRKKVGQKLKAAGSTRVSTPAMAPLTPYKSEVHQLARRGPRPVRDDAPGRLPSENKWTGSRRPDAPVS